MGSAIGSLVGGGIGFMVGGPMGAAVGAGIGSGYDQSQAAKQAAATQAGAAANAADVQRQMFERQVELQEPWRKAGINALAQLQSGLGKGGEFATKFSQTNWQQDPGYAFRMSEGMKALDRSAAARGGLLSGSTLKGAQRYGQDLASQEYQNAFNRYYREREAMLNPLQSLAGVGQTTAQSQAGAAGQYGTNLGNLMTSAGAAQAAGQVGSANALASGLGQGINYYTQAQLMNRLFPSTTTQAPVVDYSTPYTGQVG